MTWVASALVVVIVTAGCSDDSPPVVVDDPGADAGTDADMDTDIDTGVDNGDADGCVGDDCPPDCEPSQRECDGQCADCPEGADQTTCEDGDCVASTCESTDQFVCDGGCVACPSDVRHQICSDGECVDGDCPDGQRGCAGECTPCPDDPGQPACDGDQCVVEPCSSGFECADGCCQWDAELVENFSDHNLRLSAAVVDDSTVYFAVHGDDAGLQLVEQTDGQVTTEEVDTSPFVPTVNIPVVTAHDGDARVFFAVEDPDRTYDDLYAAYPVDDGWDHTLLENNLRDGKHGMAAGIDDGVPFLFYVAGSNPKVVWEVGAPGDQDWFGDEEVIGDLSPFNGYAEAALDDEDNIHLVTQAQYSTASVRFDYATNKSGDWAVAEGFDSSTSGLPFTTRHNISIDAADQPVTAYAQGFGDHDLGYGQLIDNAWQTSAVGDDSGDINRVAIQTDNQDTSHVLFQEDHQLRHARTVDDDWQIQTVDGVDTDADTEYIYSRLYDYDGQLQAMVVVDGALYRLEPEWQGDPL